MIGGSENPPRPNPSQKLLYKPPPLAIFGINLPLASSPAPAAAASARPSRSQPGPTPPSSLPAAQLRPTGPWPRVSSPAPSPVHFWADQIRPYPCFFPAERFVYYSSDFQICRKPPKHHAFNNIRTVHHIKMFYICKMLRKLCRLIICHFHPCLKCLN